MLFVAVLAAGAPTTLMANPIYLSCSYLVDGKNQTHQFTADEKAGSASIFIEKSGYNRTMKATFTPDRVIIFDDPFRFTISRVDLKFTREIPSIQSSPIIGQCKVLPPPERAF